MISLLRRKDLFISKKSIIPNLIINLKNVSTSPKETPKGEIEIGKVKYKSDDFTNVTPKILEKVERRLHTTKHHPISMVKQRIINFMYTRYINKRGNPLFSVHENLNPVVSTHDNFDSLLIPENHPSRNKGDNFYLNSKTLLRAHTTAHQSELIKSGLNHFIMVGDVYRRDEVDSTHYPVFHQLDAVRLCTQDEVFSRYPDEGFVLFNEDATNLYKQGVHSMEAVKCMEEDMKLTLKAMMESLFGQGLEMRWEESTFPFTHPSWELFIKHNGKWLEILGCGIEKQEIVCNAGCVDRMGWAFGIGLERLAMILYQIPDIRLFWSQDSGFLSQFKVDDIYQPITYKPISIFPQCANDISFWIPDNFTPNDFFDIVREIGGDIVEQVTNIDIFTHPKTKRTSHCYRIVYRHMERNLTQNEVNAIHQTIEETAVNKLNVKIR